MSVRQWLLTGRPTVLNDPDDEHTVYVVLKRHWTGDVIEAVWATPEPAAQWDPALWGDGLAGTWPDDL